MSSTTTSTSLFARIFVAFAYEPCRYDEYFIRAGQVCRSSAVLMDVYVVTELSVPACLLHVVSCSSARLMTSSHARPTGGLLKRLPMLRRHQKDSTPTMPKCVSA